MQKKNRVENAGNINRNLKFRRYRISWLLSTSRIIHTNPLNNYFKSLLGFL